jgi:hypothetical protein
MRRDRGCGTRNTGDAPACQASDRPIPHRPTASLAPLELGIRHAESATIRRKQDIT